MLTDGAIDPDKTDGVNWRTHDIWSHGSEPAEHSGWIGSWRTASRKRRPSRATPTSTTP